MDRVSDDRRYDLDAVVLPHSPIVSAVDDGPDRCVVEEDRQLTRDPKHCRQLQDFAASQSATDTENRNRNWQNEALIATANLQACEQKLKAATLENGMIKVNERRAEEEALVTGRRAEENELRLHKEIEKLYTQLLLLQYHDQKFKEKEDEVCKLRTVLLEKEDRIRNLEEAFINEQKELIVKNQALKTSLQQQDTKVAELKELHIQDIAALEMRHAMATQKLEVDHSQVVLQKDTEFEKLATELKVQTTNNTILQESHRQEAKQFQNRIKEFERVMGEHIVARRRTLEAQVGELRYLEQTCDSFHKSEEPASITVMSPLEQEENVPTAVSNLADPTTMDESLFNHADAVALSKRSASEPELFVLKAAPGSKHLDASSAATLPEHHHREDSIDSNQLTSHISVAKEDRKHDDEEPNEPDTRDESGQEEAYEPMTSDESEQDDAYEPVTSDESAEDDASMKKSNTQRTMNNGRKRHAVDMLQNVGIPRSLPYTVPESPAGRTLESFCDQLAKGSMVIVRIADEERAMYAGMNYFVARIEEAPRKLTKDEVHGTTRCLAGWYVAKLRWFEKERVNSAGDTVYYLSENTQTMLCNAFIRSIPRPIALKYVHRYHRYVLDRALDEHILKFGTFSL